MTITKGKPVTYRVKPTVEFISKRNIEAKADALLDRYEADFGMIGGPPVLVEFIAEDFLEFRISWWKFQQPETIACINPNIKEIGLNEERSDYFDHAGQEYTLAHEIGHWVLDHFADDSKQMKFPLDGQPDQFLHREHDLGPYRDHEFQAEYFASCLLMPKRLLLPIAATCNLLEWKSLYEMRDKFSVSITSMTKKLQELKLIFIKDKKIYPDENQANGMQPLI